MIGSETAEIFGVALGDRILFINELRGDPPIQITVRLTGIIDPVDPDEEYWMLNTRIFTVPAVFSLLKGIVDREKVSVIAVTHDIAMAEEMATMILELSDGSFEDKKGV